ncbi:MAG: hypothetical protein K2H35_00805 [Muribaculaceae bacterium]|nr:hypothetical protein [Muribaculaceae bacterium]
MRFEITCMLAGGAYSGYRRSPIKKKKHGGWRGGKPEGLLKGLRACALSTEESLKAC